MLARHFSHMFYEPKKSLRDADKIPAKLSDIIIHVALLSLIPTVCTYIASVYIGWDFGVKEVFLVSHEKALQIAIATFVILNIGVYGLGYGICWLSETFNVKPTLVHCMELAAFTSVPLFAVGLAALYPVLYIDVTIGMLAVAAAVYLLYVGVPIFMHIPEDEGFMYSTWIVTIGLIMLVTMIGTSIFLMNIIEAV
ncbi:MAG: YIP1 family protein [Gammaproteobacteria bacterium]|nr:YIP1 family protein [Gammaproteobacteria bacterium]